MTLPSIIQKNNSQVVEARLKKFYSAINQAVIMAENDYGDKKVWYQDLAGAELDEDGNAIENSSEAEAWFRKYLAPYMKITKIESSSSGALIVYFADGSALRTRRRDSTRDWDFFPGNVKKCLKGQEFANVARILSENVHFRLTFILLSIPKNGHIITTKVLNRTNLGGMEVLIRFSRTVITVVTPLPEAGGNIVRL